jgi:hypothetical protein
MPYLNGIETIHLMKDKLKLNTEKQLYHFTSFVIRQHRIEWKKRKKSSFPLNKTSKE